jgi:radial spoke head protein 4A
MDWCELPLVTPEQVVCARQIKHICSGDLDALLPTYPVFPGREKHYLKAQLVRITHANLIVPKGMYKP